MTGARLLGICVHFPVTHDHHTARYHRGP